MTRTIILVLAILSGGLTWLFLTLNSNNFSQNINRTETPDSTEVVAQVLVYSRDLPRGALLTNDTYHWEDRRLQNIPTAAFSSLERNPTIPPSVKGMVLRTDVLSGDIVRQTQITDSVTGLLSEIITPNMRAVAIRVSSEKIAGGFIFPDDRVDVVHTFVRDIDGDGVSNGISNTILRNVRVLAVGETTTDETISRSTAPPETLLGQAASNTIQNESRVLEGDTVTLEVTEEQARVLFSAGASGTLTLSLLAIEDHATAQVGDISQISEITVESIEQKPGPKPIDVTTEAVAPTEQSETEDAPDGISKVLVYSSDLARGTRLTNEIYSWEERQLQNIPTDAFTSDDSNPTNPASIQGMLLRTNVLSGDIVRQTQLVGGVTGFLSDAITPNMRAVAIRVSTDKIAGGFILPDDRVDVVHTIVRDIDGDGFSNGISNTVLRNVRVLAVGAIAADRTINASAELKDPLIGQEQSRVLSGETVTLEVTEEQANVLFSATENGTLRLSLLALEDHGPTQIGNISHISEISVETKEQQPEPEPIHVTTEVVATTEQSVNEPISEIPRVTIISGGQSFTIEMPKSVTSK